ncbi:hypothetical protein [Paenibacillus ferrarius]|uniref:hypothetical protein n=1 Tax=Paenibacillus ferrarius TaxID=1469647 RepID=UPI003D2B8E93
MRIAQLSCVVLAAGLIALTGAGCQKRETAAAVQASSAPPAATTAPPKATEPIAKQVNALAGITQEEAGIKIRVDMPEIKDFLAQSKQGPIIPALKQNAIPQGMAYVEEKNWIVISHYREEGKSGLLTVVDAGSGKLVKALELYKDAATPYTGHAGGVAVSSRYVWLSSDGNLYYFPKDDLLQAGETGKLVFKGLVSTGTRASFNAYADGVLWAGEFAQGTSYPTDASHYMTNRDGKEHKAWAVGYKLDPATDMPVALKGDKAGSALTPDLILSLPDSVQGMYLNADGVWLSQSYGRNSISDITRYKHTASEAPHATVKVGQAEVPVWFLDSKDKGKKMVVPPMAEGIFVHSGDLHILFESGATKYMTSSTYALDRIHILPWRE